MATLPENRTPQEWVNYYLQVESDIASGKERSLNGRSIKFEDLAEISKLRREWEQRVITQKSTAQRIGGFRYKTAAMN